MDFRPALTADFPVARSWPSAADSICPANLCRSRIGFAIAPAGFVVVAAAGFDLGRLSCSAIADSAVADPDFVRHRRLVAAVDPFSVAAVVAAAESVFVSDAVSNARSSF